MWVQKRLTWFFGVTISGNYFPSSLSNGNILWKNKNFGPKLFNIFGREFENVAVILEMKAFEFVLQ